MIECITKYFELTPTQTKQFEALGDLYREWNAKINVISRKDIDNLYEHHVLHSLAIAKYLQTENSLPHLSFLDLGTGGGFPGIPLAIMFPDSKFRLIDSIGKKVKVAKAIGDAIGLTNCEYLHQRAQEDKGHYDIIVSRAVMELSELLKIVKGKAPRLICLKGGNIAEELAKCHQAKIQLSTLTSQHSTLNSQLSTLTSISTYFAEDWFTDKYVVSVFTPLLFKTISR